MAKFRVDSLADSRDAEDGLTTLREAVEAANARPGADRIDFDVSGVIALDPGLGEIAISDALAIDGGGAVTLDGGGATRLLAVTATGAETSLAGLTLTNGNGEGTGSGGGAVLSRADLLLDTVTVTGNTTTGDSAAGGGLRVAGDLVLRDTTLAENATLGDSAKGGGAFATGSVAMTGGQIAANATAGPYAGGGGLHAGGRIALDGVAVTGNETAGPSAGGGGVSGAGAVTLTGSTVASNATRGAAANGGGVYAGGALLLSDTTLGGAEPGAGNRTEGENAVGGGLAGRGEVTLSGVTLEGNVTLGDGANGGGVYAGGVLSITALAERASLVAANRTEGGEAQGGGAFAAGGATVADTTLSGNATLGYRASGGALHSDSTLSLARASIADNRTEGAYAPGGGLYARSGLALTAVEARGNATLGDRAAGGAAASAGALSAVDSTLAGNRTEGEGGPGGALFAAGGAALSALTLENNRTLGEAAPGGAVFAGGRLDLSEATLAGNTTAGSLSGGGAVAADGRVTIAAAALTDNATAGSAAPGGGVDARGALVLSGVTLTGNITEGAGSAGGGAHAGGRLTAHASGVTGNATSGPGASGGGLDAPGAALLALTTLADNATAGAGAAGGGVSAGALTLVNATLTGNRAEAGDAAGGGAFGGDSLAIGNSLVLGNAAGGDGDDLAGAAAVEIGPNLLGDAAAPGAVFAVTAPFAEGTRGLVSGEGSVPGVPLDPDGTNPALDAGASDLLDEAASGRDLNGDGDRGDRLETDPRGPGFARIVDLPGVPDGPGGAVDLGALELGTRARPPAALPDAVEMGEHDAALTFDPRENDLPGDGGELLITGAEAPPGLPGTLRLAPAGSALTVLADDAPPPLAPGETETHRLAYTIAESGGGSDVGEILLTRIGVNDAPQAADDGAAGLADAPLTVAVTLNDTDPDPGDSLRVAALDTAGLSGRASIVEEGTAIRYDPGDAFADLALGATAEESLVYVLEDAAGARDTARLTLTLSGSAPPPAPPVARDDTVAVTPGAAVLIDPLGDNGSGPDTDPEGGALTLTGIDPPGAGIARLLPDGRVLYRAPAETLGAETLAYRVADPGGLSAEGRITFEIGAPPAAEGLARAEAQRVAWLFEAALDRTGQAAGVNFWIAAREEGLGHEALAALFLESPEFAERFGAPETLSDAALVDRLFLNVLDRPAADDGIAFWTQRLGAPEVSRADLLVAFADSPENVLAAPEVATLFADGEGGWAFG